jgi:hypothetical protein
MRLTKTIQGTLLAPFLPAFKTVHDSLDELDEESGGSTLRPK